MSHVADPFKEAIRKQQLTLEEVFQKYIIDGDSYFFSKVVKNMETEYKVRSMVAEHLGVHIHEVRIVGSAKLGFSLSPKKLFNRFDHIFFQTRQHKDKSDIDIAVISPDLFDDIGRDIFNFTDSFQEKWFVNEYYPNLEDNRQKDISICYKYFEYYSKGWFRPDFKPSGFEFCRNGTHEELKNKVYKQIYRKVGIAIYKDWFFFKNYHMDNIKRLKLSVKTETI